MLKVGTWNIPLLYTVLKKALKEVEVTTGKPRQRTECSGETSLGRSRLEPGCRTNMTMTMTMMMMMITRFPRWICCGSSGSSVVKFGFQPDCLVCTHAFNYMYCHYWRRPRPTQGCRADDDDTHY
jgi:hypothetical protein